MSDSPAPLPPGYRVATESDTEGPWCNRLAQASSPYLRQHAHNPVDWWPWGPDALAAAVALDRPIFLSVGYAACHWCHVMERESFADPAVAAVLNRSFLPIKVDREERPEVDAMAMDALLALTGEGGWPLSLWLTPDLAPIQGGTYFPPYARYGLPAFRDALRRVAESWEDGRAGVQSRAKQLWRELVTRVTPRAGAVPEADRVEVGVSRLLASYDRRAGGWGAGAKFPQCPRIALLLQRAVVDGDRACLDTAVHLLDALDRSGIHDVVGGGFHRYAVDEDWEIPHFEKMLYDNAQLARVYGAAYAATGRARFATIAASTLEYLLDTLRAPSGAFFSSQDADDAGGEGAYYTWTPEELASTLGPHAPAFAAAYGVQPGGNTEGGRTVLRAKTPSNLLSALRARLRAARATRPAPALDTKIVVGWNGLAIGALARVGALLGEARYLEAAARAAEVALEARTAGGILARTLATDAPEAVLDDYALLAEGLLDLYEATGNGRWLGAASDTAAELLVRLRDEQTGALLTASPDTPGFGVRHVSWEEGAEPSGAGTALLVLTRLQALGDRGVPAAVLDAALGSAGSLLDANPEAAPSALRALAFAHRPMRTVVIPGDPNSPAVAALRAPALRRGRPDTVLAVVPADPALAGRFEAFAGKRTVARAYACEGNACLPPISDPDALAAWLGPAPAPQLPD